MANMIDSGEKIPEKYSIIRAAPEDADQIRHLIRDSWVKTMSETLDVPSARLEELFQYEMTDEALLERQESLAHPPEGRSAFVAKAGPKVLGVCIVQRRANESGENELALLHVLPGKTALGIGRSLWNEAQKTLDLSKDTLLWTTPGTKAVDVYARWGFQPVEYADEQLMTKEPLSRPRVKMVKKAKAVGQ